MNTDLHQPGKSACVAVEHPEVVEVSHKHAFDDLVRKKKKKVVMILCEFYAE